MLDRHHQEALEWVQHGVVELTKIKPDWARVIQCNTEAMTLAMKAHRLEIIRSSR